MHTKPGTNLSFTSTICVSDDKGPFPTFKDALRDLIHRMKTDPRTHSLQVAETACWISRNDPGTPLPLNFYDARDFGYRVGLLIGDDASFNEDAPEPEPLLVYELYVACAFGLGDAEGFIQKMPQRAVS